MLFSYPIRVHGGRFSALRCLGKSLLSAGTMCNAPDVGGRQQLVLDLCWTTCSIAGFRHPMLGPPCTDHLFMQGARTRRLTDGYPDLTPSAESQSQKTIPNQLNRAHYWMLSIVWPVQTASKRRPGGSLFWCLNRRSSFSPNIHHSNLCGVSFPYFLNPGCAELVKEIE